MSEYEHEPIRGLPGDLPVGERILWQGAPGWKRMAIDAFRVPWVAAYFGVLIVWSLIDGTWFGAAATAGVGSAGIALLAVFAWLTSRTTVYTITNRRIVLRIGIALPKCINIPFRIIGNAAFREHADGSGDIPLTLAGRNRIGYAQIWPHARPFRFGTPEPMLRALPDGEAVAGLLARALAEGVKGERRAVVSRPELVPAQGRAVAA